MVMIGTICKIILLAFLFCFIIGLMIPTPFAAFSVYCGMYAKYLVKHYINKWWFE